MFLGVQIVHNRCLNLPCGLKRLLFVKFIFIGVAYPHYLYVDLA